ncbi:MAG: hypothetical protein D6698_01755 [Gammaproteobacteria bacterium]|nr:MAG: hypothetical protein D6698_01755 [Gammaproteobacteria bacterium]
MQKNPLPILAKHCGVRIPDVRSHFPRAYPIEQIHEAFRKPYIDKRLWAKLRDITMTEWGLHNDHAVRKQLWQCYWNTKPHVFHVLVWRLRKSVKELSDASGARAHGRGLKLTVKMIEDDLLRPRILQTHLQSIAPYAMKLHDALASPRTWNGVDPRHMELYRALRDPDRIKPYGSLED